MSRTSKLSKKIDLYLGSLILFLLGLIHDKKKKPAEIYQIGVLKEAAIGDTILVCAILEDLKIKYPHAKLTLFLGESNYLMRELIPRNVDCVYLPVKSPLKAYKVLKNYHFNVFIDLGSWPRINSIYSYFSNSEFVIGFKTLSQYRHYAYDAFSLHNPKIHELDNYRNLISECLDVQVHHLPHLTNIVPHYLDCKYCVFHLWAGGENGQLREWPIEKWAKIGEFVNSHGFVIYLTGSPAEKVKNDDFLKRYKLFAKNYAGEKLCKTAGLIKEAHFTVSVNTGIMHLSWALGTKTISLNGPTNSERWGAIGINSYNINSSIRGCGFLNLGNEYQGHRKDCMEYIDENMLIKVLEKMI